MNPKAELRKQARRRRQAHPDIAAALAAHADSLKLRACAVVGGYHALPGEADPALLLEALAAKGCRIAFPRIAAAHMPLDFHLVPEGEMLKKGAHGIHEPDALWPTVMPHLLLVPLLAFDAAGHRLGYGGGYYDRTLGAFRIRAIGIAFSEQETALLPVEAHDMALDGVLTEKGLRVFR